jgi:hypothetical protein
MSRPAAQGGAALLTAMLAVALVDHFGQCGLVATVAAS